MNYGTGALIKDLGGGEGLKNLECLQPLLHYIDYSLLKQCLMTLLFIETVRLSIAFTVFQVMGSVASLLGYGPSYGARHSMSVGEPIYD